MSSIWPSALASLDDSLALLRGSLEEISAAQSVDIAKVIEQLKTAAECSRNLRALVLSELPEAPWQNRQDLDVLLQEIEKRVEARNLEQRRSRLLALATELERGNIVHRRAQRVNQLNQLREEAIKELRSQGGSEEAPQTLPGPEAGQWIEWAFGLKEPEDAGSLQTIRNGFARLDDFVAHLEPNMWIAAGSPTLEIPPQPERSADKRHQEPPTKEANQWMQTQERALLDGMMGLVSDRVAPIELEAASSPAWPDQPRLLDSRDELAPRERESTTLAPHDITPPRTEEEDQRILAQERALLAGMMGLVSDPVAHFDSTLERPFTTAVFCETSTAPTNLSSAPVGNFTTPVERPLPAEVFREASAATEVTSHVGTRVAELWGRKLRRLLRNP